MIFWAEVLSKFWTFILDNFLFKISSKVTDHNFCGIFISKNKFGDYFEA